MYTNLTLSGCQPHVSLIMRAPLVVSSRVSISWAGQESTWLAQCLLLKQVAKKVYSVKRWVMWTDWPLGSTKATHQKPFKWNIIVDILIAFNVVCVCVCVCVSMWQAQLALYTCHVMMQPLVYRLDKISEDWHFEEIFFHVFFWFCALYNRKRNRKWQQYEKDKQRKKHKIEWK